MKNEDNIQNYSKKSDSKTNQILTLLIFIVIIIILFGTVLFVFVTPTDISTNSVTNNAKIENLNIDETAYFSLLGKIRTHTKDSFPIPIVVSVSFAYPSDDYEFYDELIINQAKFKLIIENYFQSFTKDVLQKKGETKIQSELIREFNKILVLGKIEKMFFTDYIFLINATFLCFMGLKYITKKSYVAF